MEFMDIGIKDNFPVIFDQNRSKIIESSENFNENPSERKSEWFFF